MWGWKTFLDPGGKLAWYIASPSSKGEVLRVRKDSFTVRNDNKIVTVAVKDGKTISSFSSTAFANAPYISKILADKILLRGKKTISLIDWQGKELWSRQFTWPLGQVACDDNYGLVMTVQTIPPDPKKGHRTRWGYVLPPPTYKYYLYAIKMSDGSNIWQRPLGGTPIGPAIVAHGKYILQKDQFKEQQLRTSFFFYDLVKNIGIGTINAKSQTHLYLYRNQLILKGKHECRAIDEQGKTLWKCQVEGSLINKPEKCDDLAFFSTGIMLSAVDFKNGKLLWQQPCDALYMKYTAGKVFFPTQIVDQAYMKLHKDDKPIKISKRYKEIANDPTIKRILNGPRKSKPAVKKCTVITCLDAKTGKKLWVSGKVIGRLLAAFNRVVIFRDSAHSGLLGAISNSAGQSVVEQLDLNSGKKLFSRSDYIGVAEGSAFIAGNKLIGAEYYRTGSLHENSKRKHDGFAAFNLK